MAHVGVGLEVSIPDADALVPYAYVTNFEGRQPFNIVIFGEKSSLADVVMPIAKRFEADVYLPSGEISDTLLFQMAQDGAVDGRPMRVFTLADFDPAGHQMPVSIGRKLQALRDLYFPTLDFEVRPVCLTVDQVRELELPSTPLKETERRADRWRAAWGHEQTEIDAVATLRPHDLSRILTKAIEPFFDETLSHRVFLARAEWNTEAQEWLAEQIDAEALDALRADAEVKLAAMRAEIEEINRRSALSGEMFDLPPTLVPEASVDPELHGKPLISASWDWAEQTRALRAHKAYDEGREQ